jgi:hypothetical protein
MLKKVIHVARSELKIGAIIHSILSLDLPSSLKK